MKLERSKVELELYGETIAMRKPTFKEAREYQDALTKLESGQDASVVIQKFLETMGMPAGKFETLEFEHVGQIMEFMLGAKKK